MAMELDNKKNQNNVTKEDPLLFITNELKFLNHKYSVERVKTSHFIFSLDVDDFKMDNLSDFGREVVRKYLHIGIVSDACEKPYKQYEVLLVYWPSNISRSVYEGKSRTHLADIKKVHTIIFAVPEKQLSKYMHSQRKIPMDDVIASTAMLTEADDWRLMESKVMTSFFNIVDKTYSHATEKRDAWKTYPTDSLNTQWKQMLFLCCFNYDVGYHLKKMIMRNWSRICRRMFQDEKFRPTCNILNSEVPRGGIYNLLVLWCEYPALLRDMIEFLKDVNEKKPCLLPLDVLEKLKYSLVELIFVTKKFACEKCDYVTDRISNLTVHMRKHTGEKPFKCEICNRTFSTLSGLQKHINAHKGEASFQCEYCGRYFSRKISMQYHVACKHHAIGDFNYRCYSCKAQYENVSLLREHVVIHANDKMFQCSICLRRCVSESDLVRHMQNHSKEKPFDCHICGKKFLLKRNLQLHYRVHSEKTFTCGYCGKAFRNAFDENQHELGVHKMYTSRSGVIEFTVKELGW